MTNSTEQRETHRGLMPASARSALVLCMLLSACGPSKDATETFPESDLVFTGAIAVVHSSTVDGLDPETSVIVNVTDVHRVSGDLDPLQGQTVTVQMKDVSSVRVGEEWTFFANIIVLGAELGVREVSSEPAGADKQSRESLTQKVRERDRKRAEDALRRRVEKASTVGLGTIVRITPMLKKQEIDREHDPEWQVVELRLSSVAKGERGQTIRFLYPGSRDILFIGYSKLQVDQEWTFILDKSDEKEVGLVVSDPSNILPASEFKHVESLVKK